MWRYLESSEANEILHEFQVSPVLPMKFQECIQSFYYRSLDSEVDIEEAGKVIDAWAQLKSIKIGVSRMNRWFVLLQSFEMLLCFWLCMLWIF